MSTSYLKKIGILVAYLCVAATVHAQLSDRNATPRTKNLYRNLQKLEDKYTLFGQQDALAYGVGWKNIPGQSDVKLVVNDYPAVYGWDIAHVELESANNIDGVPFKKMLEYIRQGFERGGVITISWHARNPLTGGSAWDTTAGTVTSVLPGGSKHVLFKSWLDRVAGFLQQCKDKNNIAIPVLFRPFHELTGNWFWWCKNVCTPDEFKQLWHFTYDYLVNKKKLHHLIFVYNTAAFNSPEEYLERYPGDHQADILSMDTYQHQQGNEHTEAFIKTTRRQLSYIAELAGEKNKLCALAETGLEAVPDAQWWTKTLWPTIQGLPVSYVLVWRNHGYMPSEKKMHYYAPHPGQVSADDFRKFYLIPSLLFEKALKLQQIYK